jgi:hypothetical protein
MADEVTFAAVVERLTAERGADADEGEAQTRAARFVHAAAVHARTVAERAHAAADGNQGKVERVQAGLDAALAAQTELDQAAEDATAEAERLAREVADLPEPLQNILLADTGGRTTVQAELANGQGTVSDS